MKGLFSLEWLLLFLRRLPVGFSVRQKAFSDSFSKGELPQKAWNALLENATPQTWCPIDVRDVLGVFSPHLPCEMAEANSRRFQWFSPRFLSIFNRFPVILNQFQSILISFNQFQSV